MSAPFTHVFAVAWGACTLGWSERGLTRVRLPDPAAPPLEVESATPAEIADAVALLRAYFTGDPVDFSPLVLDEAALSSAEARIYTALRGVARGETVTYAELAVLAGIKDGARAVGVAMARNPWPVIVPCHRVLAAGGALGGFSAPGGVTTKRRLLTMEGVDLDRGAPMLPGLFD